MKDQSASYLPCTVAVASFQPTSQAKIKISGASWWPYANVTDFSSGASLYVSGAPLGLHNFNMTRDSLTFAFSGPIDEDGVGNSGSSIQGGEENKLKKHGPVIPPTFSLNLFVCCDGENFSLSLSDVFCGMVGFTFGKTTYAINDIPTEVSWPKGG